MTVSSLVVTVSRSVPTVTPGPAAAVFPLPSLLFSVPFVFSPLSVLAVILATDPANEGTTNGPQTWEDQVAYQPTASGADKTIRVGGP